MTPAEPRFLLDENLSPNVAQGLAAAGMSVTSSIAIEDLGAGASDERIIEWCARHGWVWVTTDHDAQSRELRMAVVPAAGVTAILLTRQPRDRLEHVEVIVRHYREWVRTLQEDPRHGVWLQRPRGSLRRLTGRASRRQR